MPYTKTHPNVLAHYDTVATHVHDESFQAAFLALIHIESLGDAKAHRQGSQFYGLLQVGTPYLHDALDHAGEKFSTTTRSSILMGDADKSVWVTKQYMDRYSKWIKGSPLMLAVAHKGGAGTLRRIAEGKESIDNSPIHNLDEYVRRFNSLYPAYLAWVDAHPKTCGDT